jgi:hypothetical protein
MATPARRSSRLRQAGQAWQQLDAPYEAARARLLVGLACRAVGDDDTVALELDAARAVFAQLGAAPDLARIDSLAAPADVDAHGLTGRKLRVLRLGRRRRDQPGHRRRAGAAATGPRSGTSVSEMLRTFGGLHRRAARHRHAGPNDSTRCR